MRGIISILCAKPLSDVNNNFVRKHFFQNYMCWILEVVNKVSHYILNN